MRRFLPLLLLALATTACNQNRASEGNRDSDTRSVKADLGDQGPGAGDRGELSTEAKSFSENAARHHMLIVNLSEVAEERASDPRVRDLARQMIAAHSTANQELMQAIRHGGGLDGTPKPTPEHQQMMDALPQQSGSALDRMYLQNMLQLHQQAGSAGEGKKLGSVQETHKRSMADEGKHTEQIQQLMGSLGK